MALKAEECRLARSLLAVPWLALFASLSFVSHGSSLSADLELSETANAATLGPDGRQRRPHSLPTGDIPAIHARGQLLTWSLTHRDKGENLAVGLGSKDDGGQRRVPQGSRRSLGEAGPAKEETLGQVGQFEKALDLALTAPPGVEVEPPPSPPPGSGLGATLAELKQLLAKLEPADSATARELLQRLESKLGEDAGGMRRQGEPTGSRGANIDLDAYKSAISRLVVQVRAHADKDVVDRCLRLIEGEPGVLENMWSQAGQDWLLFHNFFWDVPYGAGRYIDVGSNHPVTLSNTFFFDRCLGWRGVCIEANPMYQVMYEGVRSCEMVKAGVAGTEGEFELVSKGVLGRLVEATQGSEQRTMVKTRLLSNIIREHNMDGAEFATIDIEGLEFEVLRCFPFRAHGIKTWVVETDKAHGELFHTFLRGGYSQVAEILCPLRDHSLRATGVGFPLDTVFRLTNPPFILGPDFLPGRILEGKGGRPACTKSDRNSNDPRLCPEQLPVVSTNEMMSGYELKNGTCEIPAWGANGTGPGLPDAVLPTNNQPAVGIEG